jgi:hypothetical protein
MADHSQPTTLSNYTTFVSQMSARFNDLALALDPATTSPTNLPTGSIGWSSASSSWEKWSGSAWVALTTAYGINITGNAATVSAITGAQVTGALGFTPPANTGTGASGTWPIAITGAAGSVPWSGITGHPTTLSGYGITDAVSASSLSTAGGANKVPQLDANGNFGLGSAPASAWATGWQAVQLGAMTSLSSDLSTTTAVTTNGYWNGSSWVAFAAGGVSQYYNNTTQTHYWRSASAPSAGASISTWLNQMTLDASGNLVAAGNVTAYSDESLKADWQSLPDDFIEQLARVKHGTFNRVDLGLRQVGVGAQSLQPVMPEAVHTTPNGTLSVSYGNAALAACVELAQGLIALRKQVAELKGAA